jgi:hypothetical protein
MEDGICFFSISCEDLDGIIGERDQQIDFPPLRFALYLIHHGERSVFSGADYQAFAFPGDFLLNRHGSMPELYAEFFRGFFLPLENFSAVDQHVVAIFSTVDHDRAEMKPAELHFQAPILKICVSTNQTDIQISEIAPRQVGAGRSR